MATTHLTPREINAIIKQEHNSAILGITTELDSCYGFGDVDIANIIVDAPEWREFRVVQIAVTRGKVHITNSLLARREDK